MRPQQAQPGRARPKPAPRRFALARRRAIWVPTWQGGLLLLALGVGAVLAVALSAYRFLAPIDPARGTDGRGARTLVVEGWVDPPALRRAAAVARAGHYERVLTSGGPIEAWMDRQGWGSFAVRAADILRTEGGLTIPVVAVPAPDSALDRTFQSALAVRRWAEHAGPRLAALDVFTSDVHARRSRLNYRLAFGPATEVGILADRDGDPSAGRWWTRSDSAKRVVGEAVSWAWTACCFWPEVRDASP